jgi:hypothetical protein
MELLKYFIKLFNDCFDDSDPANIQCPVCGYYCLGKGGFWCIDKPSLQN